MSRISLCLREGNPPLGQDYACSVVRFASQAHDSYHNTCTGSTLHVTVLGMWTSTCFISSLCQMGPGAFCFMVPWGSGYGQQYGSGPSVGSLPAGGFLATATGMAISAACFPPPPLIEPPADLLCRGSCRMVCQLLVCEPGEEL